jgi:hypothetical protein
MKKILIVLCCLSISFVFLSNTLVAQGSGSDKMVMMNGDEKTGKVTDIGDDYVRFVHSGETLTYTIKKQEINKIQFASGRIEIITKISPTQPGSLADHHNKVAVLPFGYIGNGGSRDDKMSNKVQLDCYNDLKKYANQFTLQDPVTTNTLLIKHNINVGNIEGSTPAELAEILGVEYLLMGNVTINQTASSMGYGSYGSATKKGNKVSRYTAGGFTTSNQYKTSVDMSIYNDQGTNIFSKSHVAFWPSEDSYTVTLLYLLKRTPLYSM